MPPGVPFRTKESLDEIIKAASNSERMRHENLLTKLRTAQAHLEESSSELSNLEQQVSHVKSLLEQPGPGVPDSQRAACGPRGAGQGGSGRVQKLGGKKKKSTWA
jgi:hypothetical protein